MARIELCDPSLMSEAERKVYDRLPVNLIRAMLRTHCADSYLTLGLALNAGKLTPKRRELVILRVAALSGSRYERMHHLPPALQAGWSEPDIAAIEAGQWQRLNPAEAALLRFVDDCVKDVRVSDRVFAELRRHLPENEVAETTLLTGFYMMTARFLETLDIDLDETPRKIPTDIKEV
jgi:alkylhydroperoxidase family enzyme